MSLPRPHYAGAAAGVVVAALALAALSFLGHAPNRIVPGQGISFIRGVPLGPVLVRSAAISWPPLLAMLLLAWRMKLARHAVWIWCLLVPGAVLINASARFIMLVASLALPSA